MSRPENPTRDPIRQRDHAIERMKRKLATEADPQQRAELKRLIVRSGRERAAIADTIRRDAK